MDDGSAWFRLPFPKPGTFTVKKEMNEKRNVIRAQGKRAYSCCMQAPLR